MIEATMIEAKLYDVLAVLNSIPAINAGGCALVAGMLAKHLPGARVYPVAPMDTDRLRELVGEERCTSIYALVDNGKRVVLNGRSIWQSFHYHFVVKLSDGREVDSTGIKAPNKAASRAIGQGFTAEEALAWFWDNPEAWNVWFDREKHAHKVVEIVEKMLAA